MAPVPTPTADRESAIGTNSSVFGDYARLEAPITVVVVLTLVALVPIVWSP
jgi:di/tricarboxylate transporter